MSDALLLKFIQECHNALLDDNCDDANVARDYLFKRKIVEQSISSHKIGYCSKNINIPKEIQFYGKDLGEVGVNGNGYSYFIQNRVIIPVYSEFDKIVGFATRKPSFEPGNTWWNLPLPFKKGNHLFLLSKTRKNIFSKNKVYLVEGYVDALLLYQEGLQEVCGLMGTHLSPRKIGLILRYCNNICLCLDVDENKSGQKAQDKAIAILKDFGFFESISIIDNLPIGEDPDVYVAKNGLQKFLANERTLSPSEIKKICKRVFYQNK